jgi:hypothetical protein
MDRKFENSWSKIPTKRNNNYLLDLCKKKEEKDR